MIRRSTTRRVSIGLCVLVVAGLALVATAGPATAQEDTGPTVVSAVEFADGKIEVTFSEPVTADDGSNLSTEDVTIVVDGNRTSPSSVRPANDGDYDSYILTYADGDLKPIQDVTVDVGWVRPPTGDVETDPAPIDVRSSSGRIADGGSHGSLRSAKLVFPGEPLAIQTNGTEGGVIKIYRTSDENLVRHLSTPDRGTRLRFNTGSLDDGETYRIYFSETGTEQYFNTTSLDFSASAHDTTLDTRDELVVDVDAIAQNREVMGELVSETGDVVAVQRGTLDNWAETTLNFGAPPEAGTYTVQVYDAQTGIAAETAEITVEEAGERRVAVDTPGSIVTDQRGDVATIPVTMTNTTAVTLQIGMPERGYWMLLNLEDHNHDGRVTVAFDTSRAGTLDAATLRAVDEDDRVGLIAGETGAVGGPLPVGKYHLGVVPGTHTEIGFSPDAVGTMAVEQRRTNGVGVSVAPADEAVDEWPAGEIQVGPRTVLSESSTVVPGEQLVVTINASGLEGAAHEQTRDGYRIPEDPFADDALQIGSLATLELRATDFESGTAPARVQLDTDTATFLPDPANDTYHLVVDTGAIDWPVVDGNRTAVEPRFSWNESHPLAGNATVTGPSVAPRDPAVTLSTDADGEVVLAASETAQLSGRTTLAPGSELTVVVQSTDPDHPFQAERTMGVGSGRGFEALFDVSDLPAGTPLQVTVLEPDSLGGPTWTGRTIVAEPAVSLANQSVADGSITVANASLPEGGFVVVHEDGPDGPVLASSSLLTPGTHDGLTLSTSSLNESTRAVAVLYRDADRSGTFEVGEDYTYGYPEPVADAGRLSPDATPSTPTWPTDPVATDPDDDGDYEDLTGNGEVDNQDVVTFFQHMGTSRTTSPMAADGNLQFYDYTDNGEIDYQDLIALFGEIGTGA